MTRRGPVIVFTLIFVAATGLYIVYFRQSLTVPVNIHTERGQDFLLRQILDQIAKNLTLKQNGTLSTQNSTGTNVHRLIYTYRDFEVQLCSTDLDWSLKLHVQPTTNPCPNKGIVTIASGGRTGNQLWEYASVWAVARLTGLDPYVPRCIRSKLDKIFDHLTIPTFRNIEGCPLEMNTFVESIDEWTSDFNQNIILRRYAALRDLSWPLMNDIVKEFNITKELKEKAQKSLGRLVKNRPQNGINNYTFIGVHVRRTDYIRYVKTHYGKDPVTPQFFINAMNYYKAKYHNCLFVFISDDPSWCTKNFGSMEDVVVASGDDPILDLAIMGSCNHTIYDYGTYGEWGSILAGGETVTQNYIRLPLLENWIRISQEEPPNPI